MIMVKTMIIKIITVILLTFGHHCLLGWGLNNQQSIVDLDDPRMSNNEFHGILNYHTVKPDRRPSISVPEKITNHIGKPLVPVPQLNPKKAVQSTQNARIIITPKPQVYQTYQKQKSVQDTINGSSTGNAVVGGGSPTSRGICDWMSLPNFKNVSLETGELIVRDEEEQPCYLLSLSGYIKGNEDAYFPLSNYQSHPRLQRFILTGRPNDGASVRSPYINCSLLTSDGSAPSSSMYYYPLLKLNIPFKEEIIIRVNCGYLVLEIHGDGFHLTLDSLSFYQDPSAIQRRHLDKKVKLSDPNKTVSRLSTQIRSDHLVFTSVLANTASPLLMIPLTTRYMCQNRIVLTGNNSVQLVLDRFELQRLAFSSSRNLNLSNGSGGDTSVNSSQSSDFVPPAGTMRITRRQTMDKREISSSHSKRSIKRLTRDAHVKVNFPSVIRCSNPTNPYDALTSMMDLESTQGLNKTLSKMIAERWMPAESSTMGTIIPSKYGETNFYVMDWIIGFHILLSLLILNRVQIIHSLERGKDTK